MESPDAKLANAHRDAYNHVERAAQVSTEVTRALEEMADKLKPKTSKLETVEPLGKRVLVRKDEDKKVTKGGIQLPDSIEIPTITGRIVAVSAQVENDTDFPIRQYDRILFNPKQAIPVEFDADNYLFVVPIEDVVAVFRKDT